MCEAAPSSPSKGSRPTGGSIRSSVAFAELGAAQCGFCTPGIMLAAKALLLENPAPTAHEVREALAGNLCRCTGYTKIIEAVLAAASGPR